MAKRSRALDYLSLTVTGIGLNPAGDIQFQFFIFCSLTILDSLGKAIQLKSSMTIIQSNRRLSYQIWRRSKTIVYFSVD